ncbi:MAG: FixH family protein [Candidatus Sericytochromatia bacterium]
MIKNLSDGTKVFLAVGSFFGVVILSNLLLIYLSYTSADGMVEENYYKRSLNYQDQKNKASEQEKLGWDVNFDKKKNLYTIVLKDKDEKPIKKARVKLNFFRPTKEGFDKETFLLEKEDGIYEKQFELPLKGIWDVYINVEKDTNSWKKKKRIKV